MANLKENVTAFLTNKGKAEAVANDEKFLDAVSGGTATPEMIAREFGEAGLTLNEADTKEIKEITKKLLDTPPEKLGDLEMKNVAGGFNYKLFEGITAYGSMASAASGLGCWVAGRVCQSQARKAMAKGEKTKSNNLSKAAKGLDIAAGSCLGVALAGGIGSVVSHHISWDNNCDDDESEDE